MIVGWYIKAVLSSEAVVDFEAYPGFSVSLMSGAVAGWLGLGRSGVIVAITPTILTYMGWLMESGQTWDGDRGLVIYHRGDGMIPYEGASLYNHLQTVQQKAKVSSLELTTHRDSQFNHMAPLNTIPTQWEDVIRAVQSLIERNA